MSTEFWRLVGGWAGRGWLLGRRPGHVIGYYLRINFPHLAVSNKAQQRFLRPI